MNARAFVLTVTLGLFAATSCFAAEANMGTWKLNEAKSTIPAGAPKNTTVVYVAAGDSVKVIVDGVTGDGKPAHNEWVGKFDGKEYPVTGDPMTDSRTYKVVNERTMDLIVKKGGKTTNTGQIVVAADGKSRTLKMNGTDKDGKAVSSTTVYDKQ
jgi:hypothetical protein